MALPTDIKKLGFGLMRLPKVDEKIDIAHTCKMVDAFLEAGFNYFDTAWAYAGSEDAIRQALVERYPRDRFYLATKLSAWIGCHSKEDCIRQMETSLKQTGAGYFDFYLLHNLGENRTHFYDDFDLWDFAQEIKAKGIAKHVGFSFHSTPEELDKLLTAHPEAEFVQLQINYADWKNPAVQSGACYEVARKHGKQVIVMEPVKGGNLANPPKPVLDVFKSYDADASAASWAIKFAANLDGVLVVLSGMSNIEQMEDNISFMKDFNGLSVEESAVLEKAREELEKLPLVPCTKCDYCAKVCPMNIGISGTFTARNMYTLYGNLEASRNHENWQVIKHDRVRATECIKCGACEEACPQHIKIRDELEKTMEIFYPTK